MFTENSTFITVFLSLPRVSSPPPDYFLSCLFFLFSVFLLFPLEKTKLTELSTLTNGSVDYLGIGGIGEIEK